MIFLLASIALGFLTVLLGTPYARRYLLMSGIYGVDQQKSDKPKVATSGGIAVLFGVLVSITSYLGFNSFFDLQPVSVPEILAALSAITIITLIGLLDDIHVNLVAIIEDELEVDIGDIELDIHREMDVQSPHEKWIGRFTDDKDDDTKIRRGISQVPKMLFVLPAALPLIAVGAGSWTMNFPLIGTIDWAVIYPLVLLPIGLLFVSNVVNMLAGTNGLSAGMSMIAAAALGLFGYINGSTEAALIGFSLAATLLAFMKYNFYPASILPGDSLTYLCGAGLFAAMVIGDMEKFGVFIFTPWIVEFGLKARSRFNAHSWGELQQDGSLRPQYDRTYSLTHPLMRRGLTERQITLALIGIETLICAAGIILFTGII